MQYDLLYFCPVTVLAKKDQHLTPNSFSTRCTLGFRGEKRVAFNHLVHHRTNHIIGTLRFIGRQRDGNGKKTLYDMSL